jgi:single-strand DNA-binding protein
MNVLCVCGHLGRDPVSKQVGDKAVCAFSVAVNGRKDDPTIWLEVRAWGKLGEACQKFLSKGKQVNVVGEFRVEEWTGRDGEKRREFRVIANSVDFLGGEQSKSAGTSSAPKAQIPGDDSDIPF